MFLKSWSILVHPGPTGLPGRARGNLISTLSLCSCSTSRSSVPRTVSSCGLHLRFFASYCSFATTIRCTHSFSLHLHPPFCFQLPPLDPSPPRPPVQRTIDRHTQYRQASLIIDIFTLTTSSKLCTTVTGTLCTRQRLTLPHSLFTLLSTVQRIVGQHPLYTHNKRTPTRIQSLPASL